MASNTKKAPVKYVLTVGANFPNDSRPRIERGEHVSETDFPSKKSFEEHLKLGTIVDAASDEGVRAIKDAPEKAGD